MRIVGETMPNSKPDVVEHPHKFKRAIDYLGDRETVTFDEALSQIDKVNNEIESPRAFGGNYDVDNDSVKISTPDAFALTLVELDKVTGLNDEFFWGQIGLTIDLDYLVKTKTPNSSEHIKHTEQASLVHPTRPSRVKYGNTDLFLSEIEPLKLVPGEHRINGGVLQSLMGPSHALPILTPSNLTRSFTDSVPQTIAATPTHLGADETSKTISLLPGEPQSSIVLDVRTQGFLRSEIRGDVKSDITFGARGNLTLNAVEDTIKDVASQMEIFAPKIPREAWSPDKALNLGNRFAFQDKASLQNSALFSAAPINIAAMPNVSTVAATPPAIPFALQVQIEMAAQGAGANSINFSKTEQGVLAKLSPPEMGRIFLDFDVEQSKSMQVTIRAETEAIREALRQQSQVLQVILKESGFADVQLRFESFDSTDGHRRQHFYWDDIELESCEASLSDNAEDDTRSHKIPSILRQYSARDHSQLNIIL